MGTLYRLLPRPVRRALHPVRTVQHRATPRPIRRATYNWWAIRHPVRRRLYRTEDVLLRRHKR